MITDNGELPKAVSVMEAIGDLTPVGAGETVTHYDRAAKNDYQRQRRKDSKLLALHTAARHNKKVRRNH